MQSAQMTRTSLVLRSAETSQGKEQHPAVGMPQVRYHHPEHQGRDGPAVFLVVVDGQAVCLGLLLKAPVVKAD